MGFDDLVIVKLLGGISDLINDYIDNSILNGLVWLAFIGALLYYVGYVLLWESTQGHLERLIIVLGIWLVVEIANFIGGGHQSRIR